MRKIMRILSATAVFFLSASFANAAVITFYNSEAAFVAATTTTLIDFEGICNPGQYCTPLGGPSTLAPSVAIGGVTFSTGTTLGISSATGPVSGAPYDSSLLFANNNNQPLLATLPGGVTAVGGFFGGITTAGAVTTMTVLGTSGVLDVRALATADMGAGTPSNFFGWTVTGDTILSVNHAYPAAFAGIDNFRFGIAGAAPSPAPAPTAIALLSIGLAGIGWFRRKRT